MELPTKKSEVKKKLEDYIVLIYGSPKIGKTTFCSQLNEPLFLLTEAGTNALSVYSLSINTWSDFKEACKLINNGIKRGDFKFKTIVIDTYDNLCDICTDYVMKENGLSHPSDLEFGKGYNLVVKELARFLNFLSLLPVGLVFTSHEKIREIKTRTSSYNKATPSPSGAYRNLIIGMSDLILYATTTQKTDSGKSESIRVLYTKESENWEAGDRTATLPPIIKFTFEDFMDAWNKKNNNEKEVSK